MDTDATQSLSMERQGFTKQKGAGSKRSSICWGREPTGWCCTRLDSALAVNLKGHTGGSNRRNTECGSWHSFLNLNNSKKTKKCGSWYHFSQAQLLKKKTTQVFFNCEIGPKFHRNIRENICNNLQFYFGNIKHNQITEPWALSKICFKMSLKAFPRIIFLKHP